MKKTISPFNPTWIIQKKRDGETLTSDEIRNFILKTTSGEIPDYQVSAFLMAVYFRELSLSETLCLTEAMVESGTRYDLSHIPGFKVDKHSTGGIGDKVSLILAPLAAACGLKVPMMAGRGLGHTGGTIDKLESLAGFNTKLNYQEFETILKQVGCVIIGQTETIAPADRKLYALRDVTGTVNCISLIAPSILSKKIAAGAQSLVLDIKIGSGAFMKTKTQAQKLAKVILYIARKMKLPCRIIISDMSQPLGYAVGNRIEVKETIEVLKGEILETYCSSDLRELTVHLCARMLVLAKSVRTFTLGRKLALDRLKDGSAWKIFQDMICAQTGRKNCEVLLDTKQMKLAPQTLVWKAKKSGYLVKFDGEMIGKILIEMGGGRKKVSDTINPEVGLAFHKKLGHKVKAGDPIVTVHAPDKMNMQPLESLFWQSLEISPTRKPVPKLILDVL